MKAKLKTKPNTTEICYRWPNGRVEVKYRRDYGSAKAQELINQVWKLQKQQGKECPYFVRHVHITKSSPIRFRRNANN